MPWGWGVHETAPDFKALDKDHVTVFCEVSSSDWFMDSVLCELPKGKTGVSITPTSTLTKTLQKP